MFDSEMILKKIKNSFSNTSLFQSNNSTLNNLLSTLNVFPFGNNKNTTTTSFNNKNNLSNFSLDNNRKYSFLSMETTDNKTEPLIFQSDPRRNSNIFNNMIPNYNTNSLNSVCNNNNSNFCENKLVYSAQKNSNISEHSTDINSSHDYFKPTNILLQNVIKSENNALKIPLKILDDSSEIEVESNPLSFSNLPTDKQVSLKNPSCVSFSNHSSSCNSKEKKFNEGSGKCCNNKPSSVVEENFKIFKPTAETKHKRVKKEEDIVCIKNFNLRDVNIEDLRRSFKNSNYSVI